MSWKKPLLEGISKILRGEKGKMMILLGQTDKCVLVSLLFCNPVDLDLGVRLKCSRACIFREFPRRVSTSHPRFSFGHSFYSVPMSSRTTCSTLLG